MVRRIALASTFLLVAITAYGQSYDELVSTADSLYTVKDYAGSSSVYRSAFELRSASAAELYNGACSAALSGDTSLALSWLDGSVTRGWKNLSHMESDSDLISLHSTTEWSAITGRLRKIVEEIEKDYDKPLQEELLAIYENDQSIRRQYMAVVESFGWKSPAADSLGKIMMYRDSVNLLKITAILDTYGWVGASKVGGQASQALFLVIQHADLGTQQKYLPMMRDAVTKGNAIVSSLALLEDRVALREGKKQIYGSQIGRDDVTGASYILPLEDPDNVDSRRAEVGLGPLAEYVKRWGIIWDPAKYAKEQALREK